MDVKYVASLDVGTSTVVCIIFNSNAQVVGKACDTVNLLFPQPGFIEINPEELWVTIVAVIRTAIKAAKLTSNQISALGLSVQRGSFITWDRITGKNFHNFITWKDIRADKLVKEWNRSFTFTGIKYASYMLYMLTRNIRYLAASVIKLANVQISMRLLWALQNNNALRCASERGNAMFATLDTWLLFKLTGGRSFVTDYSSAAATGMYDPFTLGWADRILGIFGIDSKMFPRVVDSAGDFGHVEENLFGAPIPINCCIADQSASMWGSCCFDPGDVKLTMGTGSFININTGSKVHASVLGLYPLIAWKIGKEIVYMVEGGNNDTGSLVDWALSIGLINNPKESSGMANMVEDSDGVFFIPAFSGLGAPINDHTAAAGFIGMKLSTKKEHLVRSLLEAIVFRAVQLYKCTLNETSYDLHTLRVDGGVSHNDFVSQLISDMTGLRLERATSSEISVLGCAYLSGIQCGMFKSKEEIYKLRQVERTFMPREHIGHSYMSVMVRWEEALKRFGGWYGRRRMTSSISPTISTKHPQMIA